jgi:hypothetical protein
VPRSAYLVVKCTQRRLHRSVLRLRRPCAQRRKVEVRDHHMAAGHDVLADPPHRDCREHRARLPQHCLRRQAGGREGMSKQLTV